MMMRSRRINKIGTRRKTNQAICVAICALCAGAQVSRACVLFALAIIRPQSYRNKTTSSRANHPESAMSIATWAVCTWTGAGHRTLTVTAALPVFPDPSTKLKLTVREPVGPLVLNAKLRSSAWMPADVAFDPK